MVYINPTECISCCACLTACPVDAIYDVEDLPLEKSHWIAINAERSTILPVIVDKQPELPTAAAKRAEYGY
ncbi:MAG TPA: 4Fe-4S binding protein [Afipia sp.]